MKKFSKRFLMVALIVALVVGFAACGGGGNSGGGDSGGGSTSSAPPAPEGAKDSYTVTACIAGSATPIIIEYGRFAVLTGNVYGNTTTVVDDEFRADMQMTNVQNAVAGQVDGILIDAFYPEQVKRMADMCAEAKIPFVFYDNDPGADAINSIRDNPYFVGCVFLDGVEAGRRIARLALDDGCRNALLIGGQVGQSYFDDRGGGFTEVFEAEGGKVLSVTRCTDPSEAASKGEDLLSAYGAEADCLYSMASDYADQGVYTAMENLGLTGQIGVYCSNTFATTAEALISGKYLAGDGGDNTMSQIAYALLQNYMDGHATKDNDGKPPWLTTYSFAVTKDNAADFLKYCHDDNIIPVSEYNVKSLTYRFNENVTYQDFVDLIAAWDVESIVAAHQKTWE